MGARLAASNWICWARLLAFTGIAGSPASTIFLHWPFWPDRLLVLALLARLFASTGSTGCPHGLYWLDLLLQLASPTACFHWLYWLGWLLGGSGGGAGGVAGGGVGGSTGEDEDRAIFRRLAVVRLTLLPLDRAESTSAAVATGPVPPSFSVGQSPNSPKRSVAIFLAFLAIALICLCICLAWICH